MLPRYCRWSAHRKTCRNLTIEVLEYLDRVGVTRRVGDARTILRDPGEMFG